MGYAPTPAKISSKLIYIDFCTEYTNLHNMAVLTEIVMFFHKQDYETFLLYYRFKPYLM